LCDKSLRNISYFCADYFLKENGMMWEDWEQQLKDNPNKVFTDHPIKKNH